MQKTNTIGVIVHELNSHFITSVLSGIEKVTASKQYIIIIGHSSGSTEEEIANATNLFHNRVDGLIVSVASDTVDPGHYDLFIKNGIPVVFFDQVKKDAPGIKVIIDNHKAGYNATKHLIQQGCSRIMHITGNLGQSVYADRFDGFKNALEAHGLQYDAGQLIVNDLDEGAGMEVARQIKAMKSRPDGLFFANDLCAAVCMKCLKAAGIKVPEEIAIVGFNNDTISRLVEPQLTTINYTGTEMGEVAATSLLCLLSGRLEHADHTIILKSQLMIRGSSHKR